MYQFPVPGNKSTIMLLQFGILAFAVIVGYLCLNDLRILEGGSATAPSSQAVVKFYDLVGGVLMNDLYHKTFEELAMDDMIEHCALTNGQTILEFGPGSGFLASKILRRHNDLYYVGVDASETMYQKAAKTLRSYIADGSVSLNLAKNSTEFLELLDGSIVDRYIFTYVLDLLPEDHIRVLAQVLKQKLNQRSGAKICVVNLTYGFEPFSRLVTNLWQLLYRSLGGAAVGGCRPFLINKFFKHEDGFATEYLAKMASAGLPSEVAVIGRV